MAFEYSIHAEEEKPHRGQDQTFEVELYFFIPPTMRITSETYSKEDFFNDIIHTLRLKQPKLGYKAFIGDKPSKKGSPLEEIDKILKKLNNSSSPHLIQRGVDCTRVFACSFSGYLKSKIDKKVKKIKSCKSEREFAVEKNSKIQALIESCENLFTKNSTLIEQWHLHVDKARLLSKKNKNIQNLYLEMKLAEEYCHYRLKEALSRLLYAIKENDDASLKPFYIQMKKRVSVWLRWQRIKTSDLELLHINENSSRVDKEDFIYRLSVLKKRLWQVLYLKLQTRRSFKMRKQFARMTAAGFAALWWLFADIFIRIKLSNSGNMNFDFNSLLGVSGFAIIFAFVFSYILKDRIKDLGGVRINKGVFKNNPDYNEFIWWTDSNASNHILGTLKEWVRFIKKETEVSDEIKNLRKDWIKNDLYIQDQIICYRKEVNMRAKNFSTIPFVPSAIHEIMRIDISKYTSKLDSPVSNFLILQNSGDVSSMLLPKTYHLDLILKYSYKDSQGRSKNSSYKFVRVILDKEGIVRVENKPKVK